MTTSPSWSPVDDDTADLLTLVADVDHPVGRDVPAAFLAACEADANAHAGLVSVNRVRAALADHDIPARRYSALWQAFTGLSKPMQVTDEWEICAGSSSGNNGRPFRIRRWVGEQR